VTVDFTTEPANATIRLTPNAEVQLLRIIQEALTNVRKHAGATSAEVSLRVDNGWVEAMILDNGVGFEPDELAPRAAPRFGLSTMHERAESIGGSLNIVSNPGKGTQVIARVPLDALPPRKETRHARAHR
jgi:signal transduction histidine kinase